MNAVTTTSQCPITRESMRILGEKSASDFLDDAEGCVNQSVVFVEWRAHCYAEMVEEYKGHVDLTNLLSAWGKGFDSVQPLGLAPKEMELLKAYRLADERGRESIYDNALSQAEDWPRYMFSVPCPTDAGVA
jgi:hypothetical protein